MVFILGSLLLLYISYSQYYNEKSFYRNELKEYVLHSYCYSLLRRKNQLILQMLKDLTILYESKKKIFFLCYNI